MTYKHPESAKEVIQVIIIFKYNQHQHHLKIALAVNRNRAIFIQFPALLFHIYQLIVHVHTTSLFPSYQYSTVLCSLHININCVHYLHININSRSPCLVRSFSQLSTSPDPHINCS